MDIQWTKSPNFTNGRAGRPIIAIIDHITAGTFPGCLDWLRNPASRVSAHYLVTRSGKIFQMVRDANTAWHAGVIKRPTWKLYDGTNPNRYTIGIEHECISGGDLAEPQYQATLALHRKKKKKYDIPIDRDHIIGHSEIDSVNRAGCPGDKFPWMRLIDDLKGVKTNMAKRYNTIAEIPIYARDYVKMLVDEGSLAGSGQGLDITDDMIRTWLVIEAHLRKIGVIRNA